MAEKSLKERCLSVGATEVECGYLLDEYWQAHALGEEAIYLGKDDDGDPAWIVYV